MISSSKSPVFFLEPGRSMKFQLPLVTICRHRHDRRGIGKKGNSYDTTQLTQIVRALLLAGERDEVD
jgi:hypothetical protein